MATGGRGEVGATRAHSSGEVREHPPTLPPRWPWCAPVVLPAAVVSLVAAVGQGPMGWSSVLAVATALAVGRQGRGWAAGLVGIGVIWLLLDAGGITRWSLEPALVALGLVVAATAAAARRGPGERTAVIIGSVTVAALSMAFVAGSPASAALGAGAALPVALATVSTADRWWPSGSIASAPGTWSLLVPVVVAAGTRAQEGNLSVYVIVGSSVALAVVVSAVTRRIEGALVALAAGGCLAAVSIGPAAALGLAVGMVAASLAGREAPRRIAGAAYSTGVALTGLSAVHGLDVRLVVAVAGCLGVLGSRVGQRAREWLVAGAAGPPRSGGVTPDAGGKRCETSGEGRVRAEHATGGLAWSMVPVLAWSAWSMVVQAVARASVAVDRGSPVRWSDLSGHPLSTEPVGRIGWGTGDYWLVVAQGYGDPRLHAIFPLVPALVAVVGGALGLTIAQAQVLVAACSGLAAAWAFAIWMRRRGVRRDVALWAMVWWLAFPYSFVLFGYGYSDATLVALVLVALVLAEQGRSLAAGVVGAFATATRPNAVVLTPALLAAEVGPQVRAGSELLAARVADAARRTPWRRWGGLVSLTGVAGFSLWQWSTTGDPMRWLSAQSIYGHGSVLAADTWTKAGFLGDPSGSVSGWQWGLNEAVSAIVLLAAASALPALARRFGSAVGVLALGTVAVAWVGGRGAAPGARYLAPMLPFLSVLAAERARELAGRFWYPVAVGTAVLFAAGQLSLVWAFPLGEWIEW